MRAIVVSGPGPGRYCPAAVRASPSTSSRWRSSTFATAPMIRCLGSLVAAAPGARLAAYHPSLRRTSALQVRMGMAKG